MNKEKIFFILSVDVYFDSNSFKIRPNIDPLQKISEIVHDKFSLNGSKINWLVSDDKEILKKFCKIKNTLLNKDDEIGIHCLLPKFVDLKKGKIDEIESYLVKSKKMFEDFNLNPQSSRILGCTSSNDLMSSLQKYGIKVDSSAIPKRKRENKIAFNWEKTPNYPYYPSKTDYRIESDSTENRLNILEVPLSTISIKTSYDHVPTLRYMDLSFHNHLLKNGIKNCLENSNFLISIIHPQVLMNGYPENELISTCQENFVENLHTILEGCESYGKKLEMIKLSDVKILMN